MKLINKQDNIARFFHFIDRTADTLFKVTSEFRSCNHTGKVKCHNTHIFQRLGNITRNNLEGKTLGNRCFTDTWFPD